MFNATEHKDKQMNKKIALGISLFAIVLLSTIGCNKEAGIGGSSTISGTVMGGVYNPPTDVTTYTALADERIFIIYGEDQTQPYDDSFRSSWNGTFRFDYLKKGTYTIFGYQHCESCGENGPDEVVFATVVIDKNGTNIDLGDLNLYQTEY